MWHSIMDVVASAPGSVRGHMEDGASGLAGVNYSRPDVSEGETQRPARREKFRALLERDEKRGRPNAASASDAKL